MLIIVIQFFAYMIIFASLAFWYNPEPHARTRPGVWFVSRVVAGSCFGKAVLLIYTVPTPLTGSIIFETLLACSFATLVVMAHGNMAKLFPREVWSHR